MITFDFYQENIILSQSVCLLPVVVLNFLEGKAIAKMSMTSPIDANVPTRAFRVFSRDVMAAMFVSLNI